MPAHTAIPGERLVAVDASADILNLQAAFHEAVAHRYRLTVVGAGLSMSRIAELFGAMQTVQAVAHGQHLDCHWTVDVAQPRVTATIAVPLQEVA